MLSPYRSKLIDLTVVIINFDQSFWNCCDCFYKSWIGFWLRGLWRKLVIVWNFSEKYLMNFEINFEKEFREELLVGFISRKVQGISTPTWEFRLEQSKHNKKISFGHRKIVFRSLSNFCDGGFLTQFK